MSLTLKICSFQFCLPEKMLPLKFPKGELFSVQKDLSKFLFLIGYLFCFFVFSISTRFGQQAELKEQNQQLLATNEELQKSLANTQVLRARFILTRYKITI